MAKNAFKKRILREYLDLTNKVLNTTSIIDEHNYYELSMNIEKSVQRMIGRLKYRD
mgnify:CR=1 FL=1|tara:strand:- start:744 stop:911 length:168 start_codon:yes stop_codon:yes gene_type:complete